MKTIEFTFPEEVELGYGLPERIMFYSLARLYNANTVVELGVGAGYSTYWLCKGSGHVYGFDIWGPHAHNCYTGKPFDQWSSKEEVEERLHSQGVSNFTLTKCNLFETELPDIGQIDLAFVDGDHSYAGIKNDFDKVLPKLRTDGLIILHDTMVVDGCREFILDYEDQYNMFTIPFGTLSRRVGITLVQKKVSSGIALTDICGSLSSIDDIYKKEETRLGYRR